MTIKHISSLKITLGKYLQTVNNTDTKIECEKKISAKFKIPNDFFTEDDDNNKDNLIELLDAIYKDLLNNNKEDTDILILQVKFTNGIVYENSIKMSTLESIKEYGDMPIGALYELLLMTCIEDNIIKQNNLIC